MEKLFSLARELASREVWSAGVELARNAQVQEDSPPGARERLFRLALGPRDRVLTVNLSEADELWQCSCGSDDDPCRHVVGTILAVRQGKVESSNTVRSSRAQPGRLVHAFTRQGDLLSFCRQIHWGEEVVVVETTLLSTLQAQAKTGRSCAVTDEELAIDHVLPQKKHGVFDPKTIGFLLAALTRVPTVTLDGTPVVAGRHKLRVTVEVVDEGGGYRVRRCVEDEGAETFRNGCVFSEGELLFIDDAALSAAEYQLLEGAGTFVPRANALELASVTLPALSTKVQVINRSETLPRARAVAPRVFLETSTDESGTELLVVPRLVYGEPPIAELSAHGLKNLIRYEVPVRDRAAEAKLVRELMSKLQLRLHEAKVYRGEDAARFGERLAGWQTVARAGGAVGKAKTLSPRIVFSDSRVSVVLESTDGRKVELGSALSAMAAGSSFVQLGGVLEGGWGALPKEWLREHEEALRRLCDHRNSEGPERLPSAALLPEIEELCDSLGASLPDYFAELRNALSSVDQLPDVELPKDLTATLRPYQLQGVRWLSFHRQAGLAALLADDMGLGKTLQALCAAQGRTLVIAPASVVHSWVTQARTYRPSLSVSLFHGSGRALDSNADVTVTTYALARLEIESLSEIFWDTIILDEAQMIRNPESQVSQAVRRLRGAFKISLSGTPVENSLSDLWSQFSFLLPGYLGGRAEMRELSSRVLAGDTQAALKLKTRVAPFILRRLKRDVAKELPPKTESVLFCDLDQAERSTYEAILGATRSDLLEKIGQGEGRSVFSALEALLRLRQACCHRALLPGHDAHSSSKVSVLMERLQASVAQGHRALVFSQWTSFLDLIEPHLTSNGITFSRIDGSTTNRQRVVQEFQENPDGPRVMLLSLKAGGLGITLTAADHVYILDPWWNPAVEDQAADRVYRIGQENPVLVQRLVARDTVEERVLALQERKRALMEVAVGEARGDGGMLMKEEILALLA
jgi:superfamily II DNA or RNA helicase